MDVWVCGEYLFLLFMNLVPKNLRMRGTIKGFFLIVRNSYPHIDTEDNSTISCSSIKLVEGSGYGRHIFPSWPSCRIIGILVFSKI